MKPLSTVTPPAQVAKWALVIAVFSGAAGVAFAAWVDHGGQIFMAMIDSGLSWCF